MGSLTTNEIRIDDDGLTARVLLNGDGRRHAALIDAADVPLARQRRWYASRERRTVLVRARTNKTCTTRAYLPRHLLSQQIGHQRVRIRHRNGDPLDCRRANLAGVPCKPRKPCRPAAPAVAIPAGRVPYLTPEQRRYYRTLFVGHGAELHCAEGDVGVDRGYLYTRRSISAGEVVGRRYRRTPTRYHVCGVQPAAYWVRHGLVTRVGQGRYRPTPALLDELRERPPRQRPTPAQRAAQARRRADLSRRGAARMLALMSAPGAELRVVGTRATAALPTPMRVLAYAPARASHPIAKGAATRWVAEGLVVPIGPGRYRPTPALLDELTEQTNGGQGDGKGKTKIKASAADRR